jgi:hypothetical protein
MWHRRGSRALVIRSLKVMIWSTTYNFPYYTPAWMSVAFTIFVLWLQARNPISVKCVGKHSANHRTSLPTAANTRDSSHSRVICVDAPFSGRSIYGATRKRNTLSSGPSRRPGQTGPSQARNESPRRCNWRQLIFPLIKVRSSLPILHRDK